MGCSSAVLRFYTFTLFFWPLFISFHNLVCVGGIATVLHVFQNISILYHQLTSIRNFCKPLSPAETELNQSSTYRSSISFGSGGPPFWNGWQHHCPQKRNVFLSCLELLAVTESVFSTWAIFPHNFILIGLWLSCSVMIGLKCSGSPVITMDRNFCVIFQLANDKSLRANPILI